MNSALLSEKTNKILERIEKNKDTNNNNNNEFLLNLWKNYILSKQSSYLKTLEDCENFLNYSESENNNAMKNFSYETLVLLYSLTQVNNDNHSL